MTARKMTSSEQVEKPRRAETIITGANQVVLCDPLQSDGIGLVESGAVAILDAKILAIGPHDDIAALAGPGTRVIDAKGGTVTPGLIDCHTHLIFEGDRSDELFARHTGLDDAGLTAAGITWGVPASQEINRGLTEAALVPSALARARKMLAAGTTTIETKSGYALDHESDLASLRAAREVERLTGLEILGTYLGAHSRPAGDAARYIDRMIAETIPAMVEEKLASFCDVYVDPAAFTVSECARILRAGADLGLRAKLHTDARVNIGGARLAAEMGAVSIDHANLLSDGDLKALEAAGTTVAFFPGFDWAIGHAQPVDGRRLLRAGVSVALATDLCPVCCHLSQQTSMAFGCRISGLTPPEAMQAVTSGAARAIGLGHRIGTLAPGMQADIAIFNAPDFNRVIFEFGTNSADTVIKKGQVLVRDGRVLPFDGSRRKATAPFALNLNGTA